MPEQMLRLAGITFVIEAICYWNGKRAAILHIWAWIISPNPASLFMAWGCVSVSSVLFARNVLSESWHPCVFYINSLLLSRGGKIFSRVGVILKANLCFSGLLFYCHGAWEIQQANTHTRPHVFLTFIYIRTHEDDPRQQSRELVISSRTLIPYRYIS